jgi:D-3-phosphoglycerate dehydrogenase
MEKAKTLLYYSILSFQPDNIKMLKCHFNVVTLPDPSYDSKEILKKVEVAFAPLGHYFGSEKIDSCPKLKIIASNTTGVPHIDVPYAEAKGIRVISLQNQKEFLRDITPTAELTLGLIIAVIRKIPWAFDSVLKGKWNRRPFGGPAMLSRLTLGVVGLGRLGRLVAVYCNALGMKINYHDLGPDATAMKEWRYYADLGNLIENSDIVTIHLPLTKETEGLFNADMFNKFRRGSCLVNTSRGEILDSRALLTGLKKRKPAFAALDVLDGEFTPGFNDKVKDHPLVQYAKTHDNLLLTPHIGGSTIDAWRETERYTIRLILENLKENIKNE